MGAVALCGGDPTVNRTALELAAVPIGGASPAPQAPAGATAKSLHNVTLLPQCLYLGWDYRETITFIVGLLGFFYIKYLLLLTSEIQHRSPLIICYSNLFSAVNLLHTKASYSESLHILLKDVSYNHTC